MSTNHGSIQLTFLYGKLMPGNEDEAARLLDDYLARESERARLAAGYSAGRETVPST